MRPTPLRTVRATLPKLTPTAYSIPSSSIPSSTTPPTSSSSSPTSSVLTHHLITLHRSAIGLPRTSKLTLESLGLHRLHSAVLQPIAPSVAGKILKVKELVQVRNVSWEEGVVELEKIRTGRREGSGVVANGRYGRQGSV